MNEREYESLVRWALWYQRYRATPGADSMQDRADMAGEWALHAYLIAREDTRS